MSRARTSDPIRIPRLRRIAPDDLDLRSAHTRNSETMDAVRLILDDVRIRGEEAVIAHGSRLGDLKGDDRLFRSREDCDAARRRIPSRIRCLLERTAERIHTFAVAQRGSLREIAVPVVGGTAGQTIQPLESAGCYAPGGRFPLCSSVLMTAVTARAAGVETVWVATPRPTDVMLASAAIADVDGVLAVGGAQAIGALAFGCANLKPVDTVVGPGNRFVTAAKELVSGHVKIDMFAGPTELVVLADAASDPRTIAADLLAQAEHDVDSSPILITTHIALVDAVDAEIARQLFDLPTAKTATAAIERNGIAVLAKDTAEALRACNRIAPEHLQIVTEDPASLTPHLRHYGSVFLGKASAGVFGDYGIGPNHVLPTAGSARFRGGLSVLDFLRIRTWMQLEPDAIAEIVADASALARLEGLEGHARAAERRGPH